MVTLATKNPRKALKTSFRSHATSSYVLFSLWWFQKSWMSDLKVLALNMQHWRKGDSRPDYLFHQEYNYPHCCLSNPSLA